ncbi:intracellular adhesion protein IcaD [Mammaliicoccus sp. Dog046]|uniref:intracellular adhesion protein IcaD n=1 Tax=Mammaliicoccus sp. Dog046 TaxID=3034233 RepID=UPI002B25A4D1|nr:intracellular adhesion protein IcaD [Mammaliicoccus sp. Dog046]WQK85638.1 intracellular adhesion protein IcaD [Mammaliicoccus sp. Dog046]
MDKSRQRRPDGIKSNLNLCRESIVFITSAALWLYCVMVLFVLIGTVIPVNNQFIQIVRIILNIERGDILLILKYFVLGAALIFIYFVFTYIFNVKRKKAWRNESA